MKPATSIRHRTLDIAVFENKTKDGKSFFNAVISKSYKDKDQKWQKQSMSVNQDELLTLSSLLERTFWEIENINVKGSNSTPDEPKEKKGISTPSEYEPEPYDDFSEIPF